MVAVPGGAETTHLINAEVLNAMQSHAHLINIARGEVVEEAALIEALQNRQISGAGLDVYEFEPKVPQALIDLDNATLLPHLGTATKKCAATWVIWRWTMLRLMLPVQALPNRV